MQTLLKNFQEFIVLWYGQPSSFHLCFIRIFLLRHSNCIVWSLSLVVTYCFSLLRDGPRVLLTSSAGKKLTGFHRQDFFLLSFFLKKNFPMDGQTRWAISSSQLASLPLFVALNETPTQRNGYCKIHPPPTQIGVYGVILVFSFVSQRKILYMVTLFCICICHNGEFSDVYFI